MNMPKGDRVLELHEQGLSHAQIGERLGIRPGNVTTYIIKAKKRRDKARKEAELLRAGVIADIMGGNA